MKDRQTYHDPEDDSTSENRAEMDAERGDRRYDEMIENRMIEELEAKDTGFSSDTPETGKHLAFRSFINLGKGPIGTEVCEAAWARKLERRLNDALARIKAMEGTETPDARKGPSCGWCDELVLPLDSPWIIVDGDYDALDIYAGNGLGGFVCTPHGETVREVCDRAALIAAAPDLLKKYRIAADKVERLQALYDCMDPKGFFARKIEAILWQNRAI